MASLAPAEKAPAGKPLKVGSPHDPAEREADRIADILTAPEEPAMPVCAACAVGGAPCAACGGGDGGGVLRRQLAAGGEGGSGGEMVAPPSVHRVLGEPGEPLPAGIRGKFERRLGVDLGGVRVHRGREAGQAAASLGARAFTLGQRVVFGAGLYPPAGAPGMALLGHELAHTLQPGAEGTLRRDDGADGGSGSGPGSDPLDAGVPDPVAGVPSGPTPAPRPPAGMTDAERLARLARIREILTNLWVGPLDEWELESLWGGFGSRLETVAGANLDLWNQSWQRGASLANIPAVRDFLRGFEANARANLAGVLTDSENRINAERIRYGVREITTESVQRRMVNAGDFKPMWEDVPVVHRRYEMDESPQATGLQTAAGELVAKRTEVDGRLRTLRQRQRQYERVVMRPVVEFGEHSSELTIEVTDPRAHEAVAQEMRDAEGEYEALRVQLGARYPILSAYSGDEGRAGLQRLATTGAGASTAEVLYAVIAERLANIARVRSEMGEGGRVVVWKLPQILSMTRAEMGISDDSLRAFMVAARVDQYESDHALEQLAIGAIALGLGLLAAVPTGGSSLVAAGAAVAAVGGAGVSAYVAYEGVQTYLLESAATGTDFDRARAISQNEPSLFWLALDIVGALVDAGAAMAAIRTALRTATTAYRELAPLVRAAARTGESSDEAMDALRAAAARQGLSGSVIERIVAGTRRMRSGADEAAVALARVEHAELEAGRALVRETEFVAELAEELPPLGSRRSMAGTGGGERSPSGPAEPPRPAATVAEAHDRAVAETLRSDMGVRPPPLPAQPGAAPIAEGTVVARDIATLPEARRIFDESSARALNREVAIWRNRRTGAYAVTVGSEGGVSSPAGAFGEWAGVQHIHPNRGNVLTYRNPAPQDLDNALVTAFFDQRPHTEFIEHRLPNGGRTFTAYTAHPDGRITIEFQRPDGTRHTEPFASLTDYRAYWGSRTRGVSADPTNPEYRDLMRDIDEFYSGRRSGGASMSGTVRERAPTGREAERAARAESLAYWRSPGVTTETRFARHDQSFRSIAATLRNLAGRRGAPIRAPDETALDMPVDQFIRSRPALAAELRAIERDAAGNPGLRSELTEFLEGRLEAGAREVGARRPDLVEFFLDRGDVIVTDFTLNTSRVHRFKTAFYREVMATLLGRNGPRVSSLDINLATGEHDVRP